MDITTKVNNYQLWEQGAFGNKICSWRSLAEIKSANYKGTVSMRYKGTLHGKAFYAYEVPVPSISEVQLTWIQQGAKRDLITFNESAPDDHLVLQGEIIRWPFDIWLRYSTDKIKMREAMKSKVKSHEGLAAKLLLKRTMTPPSYDDLVELLESYDEHVIEFSTYDHCLGNMPGRNTVIWEVRKY